MLWFCLSDIRFGKSCLSWRCNKYYSILLHFHRYRSTRSYSWFYIARLISDVITPEYQMMSLSRYSTELSPAILASIQGTSDHASLPATYSQTEYRPRNFNLRNLQLYVCMHAYVCIRVSVRTGVCMYVWVGGTNELGGVRFHSRLRGRREKNSVAQFLPLGDAADRSARSCMHSNTRVYVYT